MDASNQTEIAKSMRFKEPVVLNKIFLKNNSKGTSLKAVFYLRFL